MPESRIPMEHGHAILTYADEFKPGDRMPVGATYSNMIEWSEVQLKAKLKQRACGRCGRYWFPQDMSDQVDVTIMRTGRGANRGGGRPVEVRTPVCLSCMGSKG